MNPVMRFSGTIGSSEPAYQRKLEEMVAYQPDLARRLEALPSYMHLSVFPAPSLLPGWGWVFPRGYVHVAPETPKDQAVCAKLFNFDFSSYSQFTERMLEFTHKQTLMWKPFIQHLLALAESYHREIKQVEEGTEKVSHSQGVAAGCGV